ncbi:ABC transporter permease [Cytobacillus sp. Hz8]|uniref:ABC transporter permease n=1 Tax=Cytobacillus sp. Hz8 TaxID=3347168 RepID=UPI0035DCA7D0
MGNLLKSELFKLRKDRVFLTLTLLLLAVSFLYPLLIVFNANSDQVTVSEFYQYNIIGGNSYVLKLVPCILAGFFISSEYSNGTMKSIVASGNSRIRAYFAKLLVFSLGMMTISLIFPIFMTGSSAIYFHFKGMPELSFYLQTVGSIALYSVSFASIMAIFATIFTDSGKTIGFLLLFFILFDSILHGISSKISFFEPVYNYSIFKLFLDVVNIPAMNHGEITRLVMIPILSYIVFGYMGSYIFQKKEIR